MSVGEDVRVGAVVELQSILLETAGVEEFVQGVAESASRHIAPGTSVGITLQRAGRTTCVGSSDDRARACDEVEHAAGRGPCMTAVAEGEVVLVPDVSADERFPEWREAALAQGFRSAAGVPCHVGDGVEVAIDLYSDEVDAWSPEQIGRAGVFAEEVARSLRLCLRAAQQAEINADLRAALSSRATIDQAMGVIMAENRCSAEEAFVILRSASQHRNVKLRDVAAAVIEGITGIAPGAPREFRDNRS